MSLVEAIGISDTKHVWENHTSGLTIAKVTNIKDEEKLGRIKCIPITSDTDVAETDWCFCMTPWAANGSGLFFFPNVGDMVVLAYLGGDIHRPIVLGSLWIDSAKSPYAIADGKNEVCSIKTKKGIEIKLDCVDGKEKVTLTTPSGAMIKIDDEKKTIDIQDKGGDNSLSMKLDKGEVELKSKTKLTLSAGDTAITLQSSGATEIKSSNSIKLDSTNIEMKAKSSLKAEGATADVKANGQLTLQSSGIANLKGSLVKIN